MRQSSTGRNMRWWIPASVMVLVLGAWVGLRFFEAPFFEFIELGLGVLTVLLLAFWYIFFTGLPQKRRWMLLLIGTSILFGIYFFIARLTRVEGTIGGSGIPRFVWKWMPKREGAARGLTLASEAPATNSSPSTAAGAFDFPQFLGPNRSGTINGAGLARDWAGAKPKVLWRQPIGLGWSAFAVSGQHAITQEQRLGDELVVCYELQTGRALWAHTNHVRFSEMLGGDGPRATPTIRQGRVYAMGAEGNLDCLEESTGRVVWSHDVLTENHLSNLTWGKSCSPLLVHGLVIVTGGEEREKSLLAYSSETGKLVWTAGRDGASYASPLLASLAGQEQLVSVNAHSVTGHGLEKGELLWEYAWPDNFAKVTEPLVIDTNRVFIAAGYGVGCIMLKVQRSGDGGWSATPLWKNRNMKPKFTNLVRKGQFVYGLDEGVLACIDLESGNRRWKEGHYGHGQILLVDDVLLVQAESGEVVLVEVGPEKPRELDRFAALQGKTWNNPVLAGELLLVRNDHEAACYRLPVRPR